ncbi:MAG TPA: o-succinylbenzoate synthase [Pyrinomonadaceae bacterium]|jgi:O-succinylbenzoate synthase
MSISAEKLRFEATKTEITVKSVALHRVAVPLVEPFRISSGEVSVKESVLIQVTTANGAIGWGEASPMPGAFYSDDTPESTHLALKEKLLPLVLAEKSVAPAGFYEKLREIPGEPFAKAGLEGALWDAAAKTLRRPLGAMFGRPVADKIASGVAIGIYDTIDELVERVGFYVNQGYRRVKIKVQPGWDLEPVRAVRENFPRVPLMIDANAAYGIESLDLFRELDRFDLLMIEQPLAARAVEETAELQSRLKTPICADEAAESSDALEKLIETRAARIVNIKIQRVGGLSEALLMRRRALEAGLACWVGTMPELGVASAQGLHFAALGGFAYPTDIEASQRWFVEDVVEPLIEIDDEGFIKIPDGAGNAFEIAPEKLERFTVGSEVFRP